MDFRGSLFIKAIQEIGKGELDAQKTYQQGGEMTEDKFEWELITNSQHEGTSRVKVPGGWIVLHWFDEPTPSSIASTESMVFIPDPNHEWKLNKEEK